MYLRPFWRLNARHSIAAEALRARLRRSANGGGGGKMIGGSALVRSVRGGVGNASRWQTPALSTRRFREKHYHLLANCIRISFESCQRWIGIFVVFQPRKCGSVDSRAFIDIAQT